MTIVKVFANQQAMFDNKALMERHIDVPIDLQFPYRETVKILRMLYGASSVVQISDIPNS